MLALRDLLKPERMTAIVDVVSDEVEGNPPYQRMLDEGVCTARTVRPDELDAKPCDLLKVSTPWRRAMLELWPDKIAVQATGSFFPEYTFGALDAGLRTQDFILHCFADCYLTTISTEPDIPHPDPHQIAVADVFYMRDFRKPMADEQWKHLALIAHHVCGSFDVAMHAVTVLAKHEAIAADAPQQYRRILELQ